jgi:probable HAF family extracellular repeat protein
MLDIHPSSMLGQSGAVTSNDASQVTGLARLDGQAKAHAFLYSGGVMKDIGTLGGLAVGEGINNAGKVVGWSDVAFAAPERVSIGRFARGRVVVSKLEVRHPQS